MDRLDVRLFGSVRVLLNGQRIGPFPTRWAAALLGYLSLNQGALIHRDILAARFWPEKPDQRARKFLRNALWRVRSQIEPEPVPPGSFLLVSGQNVGLAGGDSVDLDVARFDRLITSVRGSDLDEKQVGALEECIRIYQGDFMDGHDYLWCTYERERLRLCLLMALERLLSFHLQRREWSMALQRGKALLRYDPFREHVHRSLMICHYSMGDRPLAIRQYHDCAELLEKEMGLAPMEITQQLYRFVREDSFSGKDPRSLVGTLDAGQTGGTDVTISPKPGRPVMEALRNAEQALADLRRLTGAPPPGD